MEVFFAPEEKDFTDYVFVEKLRWLVVYFILYQCQDKFMFQCLALNQSFTYENYVGFPQS